MSDTSHQDALRLGYLGSIEAAEAVIRAAGTGPGEVEPVALSPLDPFGGLRQGEVDVMLTRFEVTEPDMVTSPPLYSEDRVLVASRTHPLAGRASVSYEDVADYGVFTRPPSMPADTYEQIVPSRTRAGREVRRVHDGSSIAEMFEAILNGAAVHPTISSVASWLRHPDVVFLPIHDLPAAPVALTWLATAVPAGAVPGTSGATGTRTGRVRAFVDAALAGSPRPDGVVA